MEFDLSQTPEQYPMDEPSTGQIFKNVKNIQVGAGTTQFQASKDGIFLGAEKFADAPFSVDMDGNLKSTAGAFSGELLIGNPNNSQVEITSVAGVGKIIFLYDGSQLGNIVSLSNGTVSYFTANDCYFGTTQGQIMRLLNATDGAFPAGSVQLRTSGSKIGWQSGRSLKDESSAISCDADFIPDSDKGQDLGYENRRWRNVKADVFWQSTNTNGSRMVYDFGYVEMNLLPKRLLKKRTSKNGMMMSNGYVPGMKLPYKIGTVLKWSSRGLAESKKENDFAIAIANENGLPIVLGAEVVRLIGKAKIGDYIVPSNISGCAKAINKKELTEGLSIIGRCLKSKKTEEEELTMVMIKF
jgi:hypothetical protein